MNYHNPRPASYEELRERMLELGWTEIEISKRSGVPQPTVWRIMNGVSKSPRYENMLKIMNALGMASPDDSARGLTAVRDSAAQQYGLKGKVPLISWVMAGEMCEAVNPWEPGHAETWLDCPFEFSDRAFCLSVVGVSMDPEYREGEIILVEPLLEAQHGDDVIVRTPENTATFKRLHKTQDGIHLVALNQDMPNRIIQIPEGSEICGVITGSWKNRRKR